MTVVCTKAGSSGTLQCLRGSCCSLKSADWQSEQVLIVSRNDRIAGARRRPSARGAGAQYQFI